MTSTYALDQLRTDTQRRIQVDPDTGCWLWLGRLNSKGYGPHRRVYERLVGPLAADQVLDHLCRVRACCNPAHVEPVTNQENSQRGEKGRLVTHCAQDHEYTEENTYWRRGAAGPRRQCRTCRRERRRVWAATRRVR